MGLVLMLDPPELVQLRKILVNEHEDIWAQVGYFLFIDRPRFFDTMNEIMDTHFLPERGIEYCCEQWLQLLDKRKKVYKGSNRVERSQIIIPKGDDLKLH